MANDYELTVTKLREILQEIEAAGCGEQIVVIGSRMVNGPISPMPLADISSASVKFGQHPSRGRAWLEIEPDKREEADPEVVALLTPPLVGFAP